MDSVRCVLGVVNLIVVPLGLLYWFIIHLWVRWWRMCGPTRTYLALLPALTICGVWLYHMRGPILGADLGTNGRLIGVGLALSCLSTWLSVQHWKQLHITTLLGIPELSPQPSDQLLRDGIYGVVRHPRYLSAGIGLIATVLIVNYAGLYVLVMAAIPVGYVMVSLEERELVQRFGAAYEDYKRDVPQLVPRWRLRPKKQV